MSLRHSWRDVFRFFSVNFSDALNEEAHRQDYSETSKHHKERVELLLVFEWRVLEMLVLDSLAVEWSCRGRDRFSLGFILGLS